MKKYTLNRSLRKVLYVYFVVLVLLIITIALRIWLGKPDNESDTEESMWLLSHVIMYSVLGYAAPDMWWFCALLGIAWELVEYVCEEVLLLPYIKYGGLTDLTANTAGFLAGMLINWLASTPTSRS